MCIKRYFYRTDEFSWVVTDSTALSGGSHPNADPSAISRVRLFLFDRSHLTKRGDPNGFTNQRRGTELYCANDAGRNRLSQMDRRWMGHPVFAPEGFHSGLHDRIG